MFTATLLKAEENLHNISVEVVNIKNATGIIRASLFSSKKGFPSKPKHAYKITSSSITDNKSYFSFKGIRPGIYSVSVVHDENADGKLNTNWLGIPKEGVGSSNNPKSKFGPPSFKASSFEISDSTVSLKIKLTYIGK